MKTKRKWKNTSPPPFTCDGRDGELKEGDEINLVAVNVIVDKKNNCLRLAKKPMNTS